MGLKWKTDLANCKTDLLPKAAEEMQEYKFHKKKNTN